jgi:hypothetical protein
LRVKQSFLQKTAILQRITSTKTRPLAPFSCENQPSDGTIALQRLEPYKELHGQAQAQEFQ